MDFTKYEKQSYDKLCKKYDNFYESVKTEGERCFKIDSFTIFNNDTKILTKTEKQEILDYWNKYIKNINLNYHRYYIDKNNKFDVRYIPDDVFVKYIDPYLNDRTLEPGVADKNYFDLYFNDLPMPKTYVRMINGQLLNSKYEIITMDCATDILCSCEQFVVKPSIASYGGKNISFFKNADYDTIRQFLKNPPLKNLIFQEVLEQSEQTSYLHPESLNTIRIMTLMLDNKIVILPAALRIGVGESRVDNASSGGIFCKINKDGSLADFAYDALGNKFNNHPSGKLFSNVRINSIEKINSLIKKAAQKLPHFRLIGWDIALNKDDNPVIIEANLTMSGLDVIETVCGPLFGEYTDKILDEIFIHPIKKERSMDISQYV